MIMDNNQLICLVPDCCNKDGIILPETKAKQELLQLFGLEDKKSPNNFICNTHFLQSDINTEEINRQNNQDNVNTQIVDENSQILQLSTDERFEITTDSDDSQDCVEDFDDTCRLCATQLDTNKQYIYNNIYGYISIANAIKTCLYPLEVSVSDHLPQYICKTCLKKLKDFYQFHLTCMMVYEKQSRTISQHSELIIKTNICDDTEVSEACQDLSVLNKNKDINNISKSIKDTLTDNLSIRIDKKIDKAEDEILNVLEGDSRTNKSTDDSMYTENIVIEMISDDEQKIENKEHNFGVTIKPVKHNAGKSKGTKRKKVDSPNHDDDKLIMITAGKNSNELVVLPKGISLQVLDKFTSPLGKFLYSSIDYIYDMKFLLADDYLYDYGLIKQSIRHLRCVNFKCPGRAIQKFKENLIDLENEIEVTVGHDHQQLDQQNKELQMCYNYLFKKMQNDKSINIRTAYDDICSKNPNMRKMLPLRKILNEIFKYSVSNDVQSPSTFDEFYSTVENENYHKIHFISGGIQFYQEKFETSDGSKTIIFANPETIKSLSDTKVLFVDASFNIDSEDVGYQIVTVLACLPDGYSPILYAFVNNKTYQIYKKIFDFLYCTLAPKLRPKEIVTDYEANLYCALEEAYVDSIIGGSIFYFAQNLYKKICRLNLAKDLELNSNFRSIFNMLLMLPLLPVGTIEEALQNVHQQAKEMGIYELAQDLFRHVKEQWMEKVTPNFFCVHRMENRINENLIPPFKKLRDLLLSRSKSKNNKQQLTVVFVIEKLIDLEKFLNNTEKYQQKKGFVRDTCTTQRKIVLRAWNYIDEHPRININLFFMKVLGFIKCLENQLWIWGFYRYKCKTEDCLITAVNYPKQLEQSTISAEMEVEEVEETLPVEYVQNEDTPVLFQNGSGYILQEEEDSNEYVQKFIIEENGSIKTIDGYSVEIRHCEEDMEYCITEEKYNPLLNHSIATEEEVEEHIDPNNVNKEN